MNLALKYLLVLQCCIVPVAAQAATLQDFDAEYQIVFDDKVVARAYFRLRMADRKRYAFEAYTVPAKTGPDTKKEEILESSEGALVDLGLRPDRYLYSVRSTAGTQIFEQNFDWEKQELVLNSGTATQRASLDSATQDRLSYLLQSALRVADEVSEFNFALAEPEHTDQLKLRAVSREKFELPAGEVEAIGVECFLDAETPDRIIWIAPAWEFMPVLIERSRGAGKVRMELLNRRSGPVKAEPK